MTEVKPLILTSLIRLCLFLFDIYYLSIKQIKGSTYKEINKKYYGFLTNKWTL